MTGINIKLILNVEKMEQILGHLISILSCYMVHGLMEKW